MNPPVLTDLSSEIKGLLHFKLDSFSDERGMNGELTNDIVWSSGFNRFKLTSYSKSRKGVIRGMHGDHDNFKLIQCLYGKIQLFIVDPRPQSPTFGKSKEFILDANEPVQLLIPSSVVNGHLCLSEECIFYYQWSLGYVPVEQQIHIKWNDPKYSLKWLENSPIISDRDK